MLDDDAMRLQDMTHTRSVSIRTPRVRQGCQSGSTFESTAIGAPISTVQLDRSRTSVRPIANVEADLAMKEKALARLQPPDTKMRRYKPPDALMRFLQTL